MIITETKSISENGQTYSSVNITTGKTTYSFIKASGKWNYVNIKNAMYNRRSCGKQFDSFDVAQENYKDPKVKAMILLADSIL